jgi:hypothetical protein
MPEKPRKMPRACARSHHRVSAMCVFMQLVEPVAPPRVLIDRVLTTSPLRDRHSSQVQVLGALRPLRLQNRGARGRQHAAARPEPPRLLMHRHCGWPGKSRAISQASRERFTVARYMAAIAGVSSLHACADTRDAFSAPIARLLHVDPVQVPGHVGRSALAVHLY